MKYRFLLRPAWLAAITALIVLTVAFVGLGMWQWSRAHRTHKLSPQAAAAYVTPAPLAQLLKDGSPATDDAVGLQPLIGIRSTPADPKVASGVPSLAIASTISAEVEWLLVPLT